MNTAALEVKNVSVHFGGIKAVQELTLHLNEGEILGLIGPNGAGKTTAFNVMTGVYAPTSGEVRAFGQKISGLRPNKITDKGVARTFQNIRLFKNLSARENILVALDRTTQNHALRCLFRPPSYLRAEAQKAQRVEELLAIFSLATIPEDTPAGSLPYGVQRRLEIARAIATGARVLLLDEPAAGMNGQETAALTETIRFVREKFSLSILLIEHDMRLVMGICDRVAVLEHGKKIADGAPKAVQEDKHVIRAYLGTED